MKRTHPTPGSRGQAAKRAIAALPALTLLLAAAIALATQPSPATARKPVAAPDRYPAVNWPARGAFRAASESCLQATSTRSLKSLRVIM